MSIIREAVAIFNVIWVASRETDTGAEVLGICRALQSTLTTRNTMAVSQEDLCMGITQPFTRT